MAAHQLRPTRLSDLPLLREIEWASGQRFREYGLEHVAEDEPASVQELAGYVERAASWVSLDEDDHPVGYVLVDTIDDAAHIEQLSVLPEHQGRGHGKALIDRVRVWATRRGVRAITLTTFDHIPWNRPLYEHLGFRVVPPEAMGAGLSALMATEAAHGLDPALRVAMRQDLWLVSPTHK